MGNSMRDRSLTTPDDSFVSPRPKPAKAELRDNDLQRRLSELVTEAARQAYGKQGCAASELGKDEGNFSRDVRAGRTSLRDLSDLGADFLAVLGSLLLDEFGASLKSPKERARERLPELIREILEMTA